MERKVLRWMTGILRLDHICNQDMHDRFDMTDTADRLREAHPRWFGRALSAGDHGRRHGKNTIGRETAWKKHHW
ncbi:hypothetical protein ANCDUO_25356 [Ancylostoma duodenale]|uniref:Uncharacterized protein n=1 Tax=Ancylostoma duodenale TaxID=51022 RepID=A0A0C2BLF5_9BILA|nr:hypothetical protein ANCDUO_25356 [Ancylostoma duodenale]